MSNNNQPIFPPAANEEIMEAIWVASEMRAGAAYAHAEVGRCRFYTETCIHSQKFSNQTKNG